MPVSLGDASTGTARSGGAIRSSSPPQNLPLSFPKLLTLSNPCSAYCFGNGDSFGEGLNISNMLCKLDRDLSGIGLQW